VTVPEDSLEDMHGAPITENRGAEPGNVVQPESRAQRCRGSLGRRVPGAVAGRVAVSKGLGVLDRRAIERQVEAPVTQLAAP
jgi:hypothetical protein